jgi:hypothetical protein
MTFSHAWANGAKGLKALQHKHFGRANERLIRLSGRTMRYLTGLIRPDGLMREPLRHKGISPISPFSPPRGTITKGIV